jgi:hypothetical protein
MNEPDQTMGFGHGGTHPERDLSPISQELSTRDAHAPDPWLKAAMRDPKIATPYILAVAGIAVAIWATMGSPPKAHPVSITHQFAGPPS